MPLFTIFAFTREAFMLFFNFAYFNILRLFGIF